jgi:hypothetical protein
MSYRPIGKRFRDWVQARIDAAILPQVQRCVADVAQPVDYQRLALEVGCLQEFRRELAATVTEQLTERVIEEIDLDDMADKIADSRARDIDAEDVARHMDAEDVASYVDVDADTIAEKVCDEIDASSIASELDYDKLAAALVSKLKEAWA